MTQKSARRPIPDDIIVATPPLALIAELLRKQRETTTALEEREKKAIARGDALASGLAYEIFKAQRAGDADKPIVKSLAAVLTAAKVEIVEYDGAPFTEEVSAHSQVVEWIQGDGPGETVEETLLPEVRRDGRIIAQAKLSCRKATPGEVTPETSPEEVRPAEADGQETESGASPAETADPEVEGGTNGTREAILAGRALPTLKAAAKKIESFAGIVWKKVRSHFQRSNGNEKE